MRVNRTELAEILGVSMPTITAWLGEDPPLPYVEGGGKGKPFVFSTPECIEWWSENKRRRRHAPVAHDPFADPADTPESFDEAERRKMVAVADRAELQLAKEAGAIVEIDDVAAILAEMHVRVRSRLLAVSNKVRVRVSAYFGGDKSAEEAVVASVEEVIADAMAEIRDNPFEEAPKTPDE